MRVKLLKDTPDIEAGAIFTTLNYNACTKHFIGSNFDTDDYRKYVFYFYDDQYANELSSLREFQMYHVELVRLKPDWFQIIEE